MKIQPLQQPTRVAHPPNQRRWQRLSLGLIAIATGLSLSFYATFARQPHVQRAQPVIVQPAMIDPGMQAVNDYLRAHATSNQTVAIDPGTQAVNDYLRAHGVVQFRSR
jgi:hypothetical protein